MVPNEPVPPQSPKAAPALPDGAGRPEAGSHQLQDVLPAIVGLAQKVGGMKKLAEIVKTLEESKE